VNELLAICAYILLILALLYICSRLWIGFLMCRLFGYEKACDVVKAFYLARDTREEVK
jgi:hypothetical protein